MSEKLTLMHAEKANHAISFMARMLEGSRAGYYAWLESRATLGSAAARRATGYDKYALTYRAAVVLHTVLAWTRHLSDLP